MTSRGVADDGRAGEERDLVDWSDIELVNGVILRREEAFSELFHRHARAVGAASRMILRGTSSCDDVVAEVFVALWLTPEKFDPTRGSLLSFLRLKAKGRSIDLVRSETQRKRRELADLNRVPALESGPDLGVLVFEADAQMRLLLDSLPSKEREPIALAFFQGMSYAAAARTLGLPEGTVKSRIRSGLRHLREAYEALGADSQQTEPQRAVDRIKPTGSSSDTGPL